MTQIHQADVIVVGAGIVGLAHALAVAKLGLKVVVFERNPYAVGASIRNFGMIWPIGQPYGELRDRALKSREIWLEVGAKAGFHLDRCGSLHLAYREDELQVIKEFIETTTQQEQETLALLTPEQVAEKTPAVITDGLLGALWSATEIIVDPREAIKKIPGFLSAEYNVEFKFGTVVTEISHPYLIASGEKWQADRIFVCSGVDFETLYPDTFANSGITKVKLQMMRTVPQPENWRAGVALCGGLTLTHYTSFAHCPSLATLKTRIETETPHFPEWGIHVMMSQNAAGELIIGDSHEYGLNPEPFDRVQINQYILDYLKKFAQVPELEITETWHGVYAKLPGKTEFITQPETGVTIINALSGAGMTLSFGLATEVVEKML
ncbi:MAG: TIGR03364 family FAD-dependent oxidoreductase [Okeania sp. SIO2G4]|uniref:TIGR03364 family FAD-dependent oxidoreductase n=1 Tax=unclassified Okeania TaxID=2634635 RepID=UPI0013B91503|nr:MULTISPECIES: TIGR03364 family FAD-dependent oxidoreductase [unclassified Okeania]NEP07424.1 TIGR03364 family FAD-dependent oxidoreductase [Okeania sp. SIO4D6]NEP40850.1 TIGR03364 family FAD-dependent oxidoreductase [Okeania sp. SIO2H7]NEP74926.1 TIGR03364 family FAD-dependent oxidoreductase [Okeania sp. SIO2G5]NEP96438.1 TIGR03364 family FAD-dependent oxidoreductase [Okeania sp. SIO2F5]NEQ91804.1 TIGR03364 family FAD-dependent oxidoreductase [Okeania sp. SIO2G4]